MSALSRLGWALAAVVLAAAIPAASAADAGLAVTAPATVLAGAPFTIGADVPDGAPVQVARADTGAVLATGTGGRVQLTLTAAGATQLLVTSGDAKATATVEVMDFLVDGTSIINYSLVGYGAQFNHSLFYTRLNPLVPADGATLKEKVGALAPRFARVFFPAQALTDWQRLASFQQVVRLAQASGATILVTWSGGYASIDSNMSRFARALAVLAGSGVTNLRWVSLLNEPNGGWDPPVPKETYERMYRTLDQNLRQLGVRDQIQLMAGGLVQTNQKAWLDYMVDHMSDVLDAYSVHIYWDYWDTAKLESRLNEVRAIDLRTGVKPVYVTEFGVRGVRSEFDLTIPQPGIWGDGITPMAQTNVTAFQLGWFNVLASRLGYPATVTWDAFNAKYDSGTQDFSCIGPAPDFALRPCYHLLRLFTATTEPGWRILGVPGFSGGRMVTAYQGPAGELTVIGLDRRGGYLNDASGTPVPYAIGGLRPLSSYRLVLWNADGTGTLSEGPAVTADAAGVAWFAAPQHAVWALTSRA